MIEEQKKLVAEKLMGWKYIIDFDKLNNGPEWRGFQDPNCHLPIHISEWNPQSDRNCWDEIWGRMGSATFMGYLSALVEIKKITPLEISHKPHLLWKMLHTAPPSVMWEALIKALEEK